MNVKLMTRLSGDVGVCLWGLVVSLSLVTMAGMADVPPENALSRTYQGRGANSPVHDLAQDTSGNLYVGGDFTSVGNLPANYIAKWNGTTWSALGDGTDSSVYALATDSSGNLYAGGLFHEAGGVTANHIAKWSGTEWSFLGTGTDGYVQSLAVDRSGNVYAGGGFSTAGDESANCIAKWNGTKWAAMGSGMGSNVYALVADSSGNVYAGGAFTDAGGVPASRIAKWNGTTWSALGSGMGGSFASVYALAVDGYGNLYAGGGFTTAGDVAVNYIAKWNGTTWSALGAGVKPAPYVYTLALDSSRNLYVGGSFLVAGSVEAYYIAKWNGSAWSALGTGMDNTVDALVADSSGNVYAGGGFETAGGTAATYIAKWNGEKWSALDTPPVAAFTATPLSGIYPLTVQFTDESFSGSTSILSWMWTFGDGSSSTEQNPIHQYPAPGQYTVMLEVANQTGSHSVSKSNYVTVDSAFVSSPRGGWYEAETTLSLCVQANPALGEVAFEWLKDGMSATGQNNACYVKELVSEEDTGWYVCRMTTTSKAVFETAPAYVLICPVGSLPSTHLAGSLVIAGIILLLGISVLWRGRHHSHWSALVHSQALCIGYHVFRD